MFVEGVPPVTKCMDDNEDWVEPKMRLLWLGAANGQDGSFARRIWASQQESFR
jgi:hypothetical protein